MSSAFNGLKLEQVFNEETTHIQQETGRSQAVYRTDGRVVFSMDLKQAFNGTEWFENKMSQSDKRK